MCLLLGLARHLAPASAELRAGKWERKAYTGVELAGKTLGVLGLGRIGREVARAALGLRMRVLAFDPYVPESAPPSWASPAARWRRCSPRRTSHAAPALSPETRHLLDAAALARMRPARAW
jgi:D-3-phosphoglycerate dehydrogenase